MTSAIEMKYEADITVHFKQGFNFTPTTGIGESIVNYRFGRRINLFMALLALGILFGCQMKDERSKVSSDADAFNKIFAFDVAFKSISWEMFDTPEYTGSIPAPTDFVTLVAQVESSNDAKFGGRPAGGPIWIAPKSSRPWLDTNFSNFLAISESKTIDISKKEDCRALSGVLRRTSKPVNGFICKSGKKMLIYVKVIDYTLDNPVSNTLKTK